MTLPYKKNLSPFLYKPKAFDWKHTGLCWACMFQLILLSTSCLKGWMCHTKTWKTYMNPIGKHDRCILPSFFHRGCTSGWQLSHTTWAINQFSKFISGTVYTRGTVIQCNIWAIFIERIAEIRSIVMFLAQEKQGMLCQINIQMPIAIPCPNGCSDCWWANRHT